MQCTFFFLRLHILDTFSNLLTLKQTVSNSYSCWGLCACTAFSTDPGSPPASITLASVTSFDHTSYCHFLRPSTPHNTRPVCKPTRMFKLTSVASATDLQRQTTWVKLEYISISSMSVLEGSNLGFLGSLMMLILGIKTIVMIYDNY